MKIQDLFLEHQYSLSTAESCTGGNIAHQITSVSGSSGYFLGSVVSYANSVKENVLGVRREDLNSFGAVSEPVALQMVVGVLKLTGSNFAIATTGIAGPNGGSLEKPVGTVWIGVGNNETQIANKYIFKGDRHQIIAKATSQALSDLELFVLNAI